MAATTAHGLLALVLALIFALVAPFAHAVAAPAPLRAVAFPDAALTGDLTAHEALTWFDEVVVDPGAVKPEALTALLALRGRGVRLLAALPATAPDALVARAGELARKGYGGWVVDACERSRADAALAGIPALRRSLVGTRLYLRCPQPLHQPLLGQLDGVVVEHPLSASDARGERQLLPEDTRLLRANSLRTTYLERGLMVIATDQVPRGQRDRARALARELREAGVVPWIEVAGSLRGVGLVEPVPRRILGIYNHAPEDFLPFTNLHRLLALPLEYQGYVIDYWDLRKGLPPGHLEARYAGVVTWFTDDLAYPLDYADWLVAQIDRGVRFAMFGRIGATPTAALLDRLGVTPSRQPLVPPITITARDEIAELEAPLLPLSRGLPPWHVAGGTRHVEISDSAGQRASPVATGRFGGLALDPYLLERGHYATYRWRIDPFAFLTRALDLHPMPVPDPTTENGRRILLTHIDGDGFNGKAALPGSPFTGEVILRDFLEVYRLPTTVSFVEGEIGARGVNPKLAPQLEAIARTIAALPHVELASHTFSHPFDWPREASYQRMGGDRRRPHLPIRGYVYSAAREVQGSVDYLNRRIAPTGKQVTTFLWSGSALPAEDVFREVAAASLSNVNGLNCDDPVDTPGLTQVPSLYRPVGPYLQIYAPAHNETVYIESGKHGNQLFGFANVVKMFEFTERPRRLKPIDIYYHFYSGARASAVKALRDVYLWASKQETIPLHLRDYAAKATEHHGYTVARHADGGWELRGLEALRTVRVPTALGWPDLPRSQNVIGVRDGVDGRYVALLPAAARAPGSPNRLLLALGKEAPQLPHLQSANAPVLAWRRERGGVRFRLRGHLPVVLSIAECFPRSASDNAGGLLEVDRLERVTRVRFAEPDTGDVFIDCQP